MCVCDVCVSDVCVCGQAGGGGRRRSGYSTKNKNPTRQCGEKCILHRLSRQMRSHVSKSKESTATPNAVPRRTSAFANPSTLGVLAIALRKFKTQVLRAGQQYHFDRKFPACEFPLVENNNLGLDRSSRQHLLNNPCATSSNSRTQYSFWWQK